MVKQNEHDMDAPVIVTFADGETAKLPSLNEMIEAQQKFEQAILSDPAIKKILDEAAELDKLHE